MVPLVAVPGAVVTFDEEQDMHRQQELMKTVLLRAAASTTLMAVVGAGRRFIGQDTYRTTRPAPDARADLVLVGTA